jgi:hypothetical protein
MLQRIYATDDRRSGVIGTAHTFFQTEEGFGNLLGRGIGRGRGVLMRVVGHGNLDGELAGSVGRVDLLFVNGGKSLLLGILVSEGDEAISARAAVAHADDVSSGGLVGLEDLVKLSIIGGEGQVSDEESGLRERTVLLGLALSLARGSTAASTASSASTSASASARNEGGGITLSGGTAIGTTGSARSAGSARLGLTLGITSGLSARLGNLNVDLTASNLLLVHKVDSLVSLGLSGEADEGVAERTASAGDNVGRNAARVCERKVRTTLTLAIV